MGDSSKTPRNPEAANQLIEAIDVRLLARDRDGAVTTALEAVRAGDIGIADLYTRVLAPLMVEVGERWRTGLSRVWEEHYASNSVRAIVDALAPDVIAASATVPRVGRHALLACPPGEQHDLGLRMLADRFRLAGWDVSYLGTDTPVAEIVAAAEALGVDTVVLSASTHFNRALLRDSAEQIRAALPRVTLLVGGPAFALDRDWPATELLDEVALGLPGSLPATDQATVPPGSHDSPSTSG